MAKSRLVCDLIIEMGHLGDELGHPPTQKDVSVRAARGEMASVGTYLKRLGTDPNTGKTTWGTVLATCGMEIPDDRNAKGKRLTAAEKAARAREKREKKQAREDKAKQASQKKNAKSQSTPKASNASSTPNAPPSTPTPDPAPPAAPVPPRVIPPMVSDNSVAGRKGMADNLALVNLTGYPLRLTRRKKTENLPSSGRIQFFADSYKFLDDQVVNDEINQLFGGIQTKRIGTSYCFVDLRGNRHNLPAPQPGTYYLMSRRSVDRIGATGRTTNDLLFPIQYEVKSGVLVVTSVGVRIARQPR